MFNKIKPLQYVYEPEDVEGLELFLQNPPHLPLRLVCSQILLGLLREYFNELVEKENNEAFEYEDYDYFGLFSRFVRFSGERVPHTLKV